jgi:hypothetical protein
MSQHSIVTSDVFGFLDTANIFSVKFGMMSLGRRLSPPRQISPSCNYDYFEI